MKSLFSKEHVMEKMEAYVDDLVTTQRQEWEGSTVSAGSTFLSSITQVSYDVLFTKEDLLIFFLTLCADQNWMFYVACNVLVTFSIHFYWV